ncbi:RNA-binding protein [Patescibacteria group bacterium]|nr:RNA-binding protein [Patescibacteria group bacterium]
MAKNLFVGGLSYNTTEEMLREAFEQIGKVNSAKIIMDKSTGRSKGFGFVEMENDNEAQTAIGAYNGQKLDGRELKVNDARRKDAI